MYIYNVYIVYLLISCIVSWPLSVYLHNFVHCLCSPSRPTSRHSRDSDTRDHSDRNDRYTSSSRRRYSYSHSRSRSRSRDRAEHRTSRGSRHRYGDNTSDFSDHGDSRYSDKKHRYSSSKKRRRDNYSDYSGSEYSDDRYSRRHRDDYDSERNHRERSSERHSRRLRTDDDRSSRRQRRRSSRSRSRSKESRDSSKRHREKSGSSSSSKKKKKDKKDKRHKKDRTKDDNGTPKVPKKVTVGRVGKPSSFRTIAPEAGEVGGTGDTPLDKAQAVIAESIDEKRKQEKLMMEQREENRKLENRIQQHIQQSGRSQTSGQQLQSVQTSPALYPTGVYPQMSPTDMTQAGYYSSAYAGYQYPAAYAGQNWGTGPAQWGAAAVATSGADQHVAQYAQTGVGEQQYGTVATVGRGSIATAPASAATTGTGDQQYGSTGISGTGEQQYGDSSVAGTGEHKSGDKGIGEQKYSDSQATEQHEDASGSTSEEQTKGDARVSGTGEQKHEDMSMSGTDEQKSSEIPAQVEQEEHAQVTVQSESQPTQPDKSDTGAEPVELGTAETVDLMAPHNVTATVSSKSMHHTDDGGTDRTLETGTEQELYREKEVGVEEGMREEGEESEEIAECEMEIDSGESSPAQSPPLTTPFDSAVATTDSAVVSETSSTAMADKTELQAKDTPTNATVGDPGPTSSAPQRVNSDVVSSDVMMAHGGKAGEPESSPEPLPPGVEVDKKTAAQSSAPPPEAG